MDRSYRQKINKETLALNDTSDLIYLLGVDIHRTKWAEYLLFSKVHEIFSRTDHIVGHKTSQ